MSSTSEVTNGDRREQLEHRAAEVRRRLEQRLDVIDDRRQQLTAIARAAIKPPIPVVLIAAAGAVTTALVVRGIRRRRRQQSWAALLSPAEPERARESLFANAFKKAALSLVAVAVQRLGTRGLDLILAEGPAATPVPLPPRPRASTPVPERP